ncbi:MAG: hypothetical protein A2511_01850, partial [Deltaproteobacteria bacterium RIFOXYD12_FULL_50_9]
MIRRRKKAHDDHGGSHGSWKVAYADLVTAMMAFFLLLWLLTLSSPAKKAQLSRYFTSYNMFESGGSPVSSTSKGDDSNGPDISDPASTFDQQLQLKVSKSDGDELKVMSDESLADKISKDVEEKLGDFKDQVMVEVVEEGVRIQMVDKEGKSDMFPVGSAAMTPKAREIIKVINTTLKTLSAKIILEGHTDARVYREGEYNNWELSIDRASAARRELSRDGLNLNRLSRVSGFADTRPLFPADLNNPGNRRISILV